MHAADCPAFPSAYVSLGSNMGDSAALLKQARKGMDALPGLRVDACSSIYVTEPQGLPGQPFFLNQVVRLRCDAAIRPEGLMKSLLELEQCLGRRRDGQARFGPRCMDLDLLLFGNQRINAEGLTLPHPRMLERAFVLVPLVEMAPGMVLPQGMTVENALASIRFARSGHMIFQRAEAAGPDAR